LRNYRLRYSDEQDTLVRFELTTPNLDLAGITVGLGIEASECWKKGDLKHGSTKLPPYTFGMWKLNTPCSTRADLDIQLPLLLDQLEALPPTREIGHL
jgi:hypothetical protein